MGKVTIGSKTYTGNNISIVNGRVTIDGVLQPGEQLSGVVEVRVVEGTVHHLSSDASINCNDVTGNVQAGGSVNCDSVGGSVSAGGSINCDSVGGSVSAGGSVHHR